MARSWNQVVVLATLLAAACAHEPERHPCRVAVMPVDVLDGLADHGRVLQASVAIELDASPEHGTVDDEDVNRALTGRDEELGACVNSDLCLAAVGELSAADEVLALQLATAGTTQVVRARLVDVHRGVTVQQTEETVGGDRRALAGYAPRLMRRMFPAAEPAWYESWWLWSAAAAVVGISAATAALLMSRDNDNIVDLGNL